MKKRIGGIKSEMVFLKRIGKLAALFLIMLGISYFFIPSFSRKKILVEIPKGVNSRQISGILWENKIIANPYFFSMVVKILNYDSTLKAGVYEFDSPNLLSVLDKLHRGKVKLCKVTIPEGLPKWEVAELLAGKEVVDQKNFLEIVNNPVFFYEEFSWLDSEESLEGYLFPDTYYFTLREEPVRVAKEFLAKFEEIILPLYQKRNEKNEFSLHQIITLASIVEREAKVSSEKPIIAGVFYNRLKKGMKLGACPTVNYALGDFDEKLSKDQLNYPSVYNTYLHLGLPPGPICNPGVDSIKAAISPAGVNYLYFVSKGDGTHEFTSTYRDHLQAIKKYQRG